MPRLRGMRMKGFEGASHTSPVESEYVCGVCAHLKTHSGPRGFLFFLA